MNTQAAGRLPFFPRFGVHLVELRLLALKGLSRAVMEDLRALAASLDDPLHGPLVNARDVGGRRDGVPPGQALHNELDLLLGELGVLHERAPAFLKTRPAAAAGEASQALAIAVSLRYAEAVGPEPVEVDAVRVGAREAREVLAPPRSISVTCQESFPRKHRVS